MPCTVERSAQIEASPEWLYDLTQDYRRRLEWDPFLREARLLDGKTSVAVGVRSWCVARKGLGMETEYVTCHRPTATAVQMTRGPWIFESVAAAWRP